MGTETNSNLLNYADYTNLKRLENLFRMYYDLKKMATKGNTIAICIYLDLEYCISKVNNKEIIKDLMLNYNTWELMAKYKLKDMNALDLVLKNALTECSKILEME